MTVSITTNKTEPYATNGSQTVFYFDFKVLDDDDLIVYYTDSDGEIETLTLTTDYTVSGVGEEGGGYITCTTAPATGGYIQIYRETPQTQDLDLATQSAVPAEALETRLDKLTMIVQELEEKIGRCYIAAPTQEAPEDPTESSIYVLTGAADPTPGDPYVEGQLFFNTTANTLKCHVYTGGAWTWQEMGDADTTYMGMLPRTAGSGAALSGNLYLGGYQVKGVGAPTAATDAATYSLFDTSTGHNHDGTDSARLYWTYLSNSTHPRGYVLGSGSSGTCTFWPAGAYCGNTLTDTALTTSYQTAATVSTIYVPHATTSVTLLCSAHVTFGLQEATATNYRWDLQLVGSGGLSVEKTNIFGYRSTTGGVVSGGHVIIFAYKDTPGVAGAYNYYFQLKTEASVTSTMSHRAILATVLAA